MNGSGIASAGGFGKVLAEWIADSKLSLSSFFSFSLSLSLSLFHLITLQAGNPPCDLSEFDITRLSPHTVNRNLLRDRALEILSRFFSLPWPRWELESGRGIKKTPFHSRLEAKGASFGCVYGWERPNWFAKEGGKSSSSIRACCDDVIQFC